jgi:hypothetical protein
MIYENVQIKELFNLKHRNDNELHTHYNYEDNLIKKMIPNHVYKNDTMYEFIKYLKNQWIWMIESILPIKNFYNYTVDKYWNKHNF